MPPAPSDPNSPEALKARSRRNIVLALGLVAFVILVFVVSLVQMGAHVANRPF